jgi:1,4-dihydroxy-2-naphthoate octaprenyltransferase
MRQKLKNIVRALRLPFISASALPFIFGSLIERGDFNFLNFLLGFIAVIFTHLSANLINDYADSMTGADWQDKNFYQFFGGSKLIQAGIFPEKFYFNAAIFCALISFVSVAFLALVLNRLPVIGFYLLIIFLSWSYSHKPLQFSYHKLGEVFIFLLFGPALVMGGYFIQSGVFPDLKSFILSLPFGFLATAILFANEIPDFSTDYNAKKFTWVCITGQERAFWLYLILVVLGLLSVLLSILMGFLNPVAFLYFFIIFPAAKASGIQKIFFNDKTQLIESSKLTIGLEMIASLILILAIIL